MNSYRVVPVVPDRWAVEWTANDVVQGLIYGTYDTKAEATFAVYEMARMEFEEGKDP